MAGQRDRRILVVEDDPPVCALITKLLRDAGADDYIVKPFDGQELRSRVRLHFCFLNAVRESSQAKKELAFYHTKLRRQSLIRTSELVAAQEFTVLALAKLVEARDKDTGNHLLRIREYCQSLAMQLQRNSPYASQIEGEFLECLYRASPLHDIGKVAISDDILLKPGKLTPGEFESMKIHTVIGAEVLEKAASRSSSGSFFKMAAEIARHHHERYDGHGYPAGLAGQQIPVSARIVTLADVYDALTSNRPYKQAWPAFQTKHMIEQESGRLFDPVIVDAFVQCFSDFLRIQRQFEESQGTHTFDVVPITSEASPAFSSPTTTPDPEPSDLIYSRLGEDAEYSELLAGYVSEMSDRVAKMQETFRAGDPVELTRLAHQLKGSAGSYGFEKLSPCAAQLERAVRDNFPEEEICQRLRELISMCRRVRAGSPTVSSSCDQQSP